MNEVIFRALCACFGLDPESGEAAGMILPAYEEPENAPAPPRNRDAVYYAVFPEDEPGTRYQSFGMVSGHPAVSSPEGRRLLIICYGPHCEENALTIRAFLYADGAGFPRAILRAAGIYPVPDPPMPAVIYEEENSLWRKRADWTVSLRLCGTRVHPGEVGRIGAAPVIHFLKGD